MSSASPMAMLAINPVAIFNSMPNQPMMPKAVMVGMVTTRMATIPTLADKYEIIMMEKTIPMVNQRLLI